MRIHVVLLLAFFSEASSHTQYARNKKHESAGGEWDTSPLPKRSHQTNIRPQQPNTVRAKEDAVVSPDGSVRVEAVVRAIPEGGSSARPIKEHVQEKSVEPQVLRAAAVPEPSVIRAAESAPAPHKNIAMPAPVDATILIYDTIDSKTQEVDDAEVSLLQEQVSAIGWENKVVGVGSSWQGWASKLTAMLEELSKVDARKFVVISDSHDVLVNTSPGGIKAFTKKFQALTAGHQGAVVVSGGDSCCVAAMNLVGGPGKLIGQDGSRTQRSCSSGVQNCLHRGAEFDLPWQAFFKETAEKRGFLKAPFPYLNARILAGYAGDVLRIYRFLQAQSQEDDQALLSEAMYRRPDWFVVDYEQHMFGSNGQQGCQYEWIKTDLDNIGHFRNRVTGSAPLFIQTSGQFTECYLEKTTE